MPILQTEYGYIYKKNNKKTGTPTIVKLILFFVLSVIIVVGCFYVFSAVNLTNLFGLNKYKIFDEQKYFAVVVAEGKSYFDVSDIDKQIKQQGGAGYVLNLNNNCYVIANIYPTNEDAQKVCDNLSNSFNATVLTLKLSSLVLSTEYTSAQITALKNSLDLVNQSHQKLYDVCISLDKGEILDAEAKQKLQVFKESCQYQKESLAKVFLDNCDNIVTHVKIFESELISSLNALVLSDNLSVDIKYTMASILNSFLSMENSITK
ncbi:MAG: hypothetical protein ACI4TZ_03725 [Christensenellales bacterium]